MDPGSEILIRCLMIMPMFDVAVDASASVLLVGHAGLVAAASEMIPVPRLTPRHSGATPVYVGVLASGPPCDKSSEPAYLPQVRCELYIDN